MNHMPGPVLRTLRERAGLTTTEAAVRAKVAESYLVGVETGQILPSDAWLGHVASILADELIQNADPPSPDDSPRAYGTSVKRMGRSRTRRQSGWGKEFDMSDQPHTHHSDDAVSDDAPPTDVVSDEVKEDAALAEEERDAASDRPAQTHP